MGFIIGANGKFMADTAGFVTDDSPADCGCCGATGGFCPARGSTSITEPFDNNNNNWDLTSAAAITGGQLRSNLQTESFTYAFGPEYLSFDHNIESTLTFQADLEIDAPDITTNVSVAFQPIVEVGSFGHSVYFIRDFNGTHFLQWYYRNPSDNMQTVYVAPVAGSTVTVKIELFFLQILLNQPIGYATYYFNYKIYSGGSEVFDNINRGLGPGRWVVHETLAGEPGIYLCYFESWLRTARSTFVGPFVNPQYCYVDNYSYAAT